ncbi:SDR family NAD(P)-dependent oxidoreductase [Cupriavidus basilensis]
MAQRVCALRRKARRSLCWISAPRRRAGVADRITEAGGRALAIPCDITDRASVDVAIAAVQEALGPVDVLVNNAGWDVFRPFTKTEPAQWERLIAINLTGALHMHHAVLPAMVERKRGASSASRRMQRAWGRPAKRSIPHARAGWSFSKTIAREHARHGITVNVVCPGADTDRAVRRLQAGRRQSREAHGSLHAFDPARPHRPARRPARRHCVLCQRRRRIHHRTGAQRVRRTDHERLMPALPQTGDRSPCNTKTSSMKSATARRGSPSTAPRR